MGLLPILLLSSVAVAECNNAITATTNHLIDNNNGTVGDLITGLTWKKCSEGQNYNSDSNSCDGVAITISWQAALQQAQAVNAGDTGESLGQTNWRVPNIKELSSIVELSCSNPAVNEVVFPATPSSYYWSSSPNPVIGNLAFVVIFYHGNNFFMDKSNIKSVRLVRSGQ